LAPLEKLRKNPLVAPAWKNPSDAHASTVNIILINLLATQKDISEKNGETPN